MHFMVTKRSYQSHEAYSCMTRGLYASYNLNRRPVHAQCMYDVNCSLSNDYRDEMH